MRCLALAAELAARGAEVHFLTRRLPGHLGELIARLGHVVHWLPDPAGPADVALHGYESWLGVPVEQDRDAAATILRQLRPDWLIVDHYALDRRWEGALRQYCGRIMAIDDLADRPHDCDLLLDQNFYLDNGRYGPLLNGRCVQLLGPRYALLRPEFAVLRQQPRLRDGVVRRLLIAFGGMDAHDHTGQLLQALEGHLDGLVVNVVIGQAHPRREALRQFCTTHPNVCLHVQTERMGELIGQADLAIGASGIANWERFCLGTPAIVLAVADNQVPLLQDLQREGLVLGVTPESPDPVGDCVRLFEYARHQPALLQGLSRRGAGVTDGKGVQRVIRRLLEPRFTLRPATAEDCRDVYEWRNAPENRRHSHSAEIIEYATHKAWFDRVLEDPDRMLLIATLDDRSVAVVRFDMEGRSAVISIYLVPGSHGQGWGAGVIRQASEWLAAQSGVTQILAEVRHENHASAAVFREAGYREDHEVLMWRQSGCK